jgi:hypothetical protein
VLNGIKELPACLCRLQKPGSACYVIIGTSRESLRQPLTCPKSLDSSSVSATPAKLSSTKRSEDRGDEHLHVARRYTRRDADRVFHRGTRADDHRLEGVAIDGSVRSGHYGFECWPLTKDPIGAVEFRIVIGQFRRNSEQSTGLGRSLSTGVRMWAGSCTLLVDAGHVAAHVLTDLLFVCDEGPIRKSYREQAKF